MIGTFEAQEFIRKGIAQKYSTSSSYAVNDYVIYLGSLYRCIVPIVGGENWTAAHWEAAELGSDITDLKNAYERGLVVHTMSPTITTGYYVNESGIVTEKNTRAMTSKLDRASRNMVVVGIDSDTYLYRVCWYNSSNEFEVFLNENFTNERTNVPQDALYVRFNIRRIDGSNITSSEASAISSSLRYYTDTDETLTLGGHAADAKATGDRIVTMNNTLEEVAPVSLGAPYTLTPNKAIYATGDHAGDVYDNNNFSCTDYIDISGAKQILYTRIISTTASPPYGMAYYDENKTYIGANAAIGGATQFQKILYQQEPPSNAKYARFTVSGGKFELYDKTQYDNSAFIKTKLIELGMHSMPAYEGALNIVKRCRQCTDIKWTPAVDLPRRLLFTGQYVAGIFKAGTEYTGIPYGRSDTGLQTRYGKTVMYVGRYIGLDTFVTAASNKDAIMCKEMGDALQNNRTTAYSLVCSGMTCYALNVPYYTTANIANIPGMFLAASKVDDNGTRFSALGIQIGDILNYTTGSDGHSAIITDIVKDENGDVTHIEVSEATTECKNIEAINGAACAGGNCYRNYFTLEEFYTTWAKYSLLRYKLAYSVPYTPSPFVQIGNEGNVTRQKTALPVIPYEGDNFYYHEVDIENHQNGKVKLVIGNMLGLTHIRVLSDAGGDWNDITGSPFAIEEGEDSLEISITSPAHYEAYVCNSDFSVTAKGTSCKWTIAAST